MSQESPHAVLHVPLHVLTVGGYCIINATENRKASICDETNTEHQVRLILTPHFRSVRTVAKTAYYLRHVRPSVSMY